ncbi:MAG: NAD+ synthase [Aquificaceae bacterium]|nr:NAD+ synthase [Aquificaceae bacterium]
MGFLNLSLCQINPTVGWIEENLEKIKEAWQACDHLSHLVVFPELALSGYPPEDLLLRLDFIQACHRGVQELVEFSQQRSSLALVGAPYYDGELYNALLVIGKGRLQGVYRKTFLPNYSVFDEKRYFKAGGEPLLLDLGFCKVGLSVCEDIWHPDGWERVYALAGCEVLISVNASPYYVGKQEYRENFLKARAQDNIAYIVYANLVGGQDELVFDGRSLVIDPEGRILARAKAFEEDLLSLSLDVRAVRRRRLLDLRLREKEAKGVLTLQVPCTPREQGLASRVEDSPKEEEELWKALCLSLRDYVAKNRFDKVVLGLSGGIDSSLVACIAVEALGRERVVGVFMPSEFTSQESAEDARQLAKNLGIELLEYPIRHIYEAYLHMLSSQELTVAEENLQARIRANMLFYLSNKHRWLVLSTSNKSESAVGYSTIYGDMAGGFAPIKDLYKGQVYRLARHINARRGYIPERILSRPPTAELRPGQTDQETLPPYELLDQVLELYIEEGLSYEELKELGFEKETLEKVLRMVKAAEYKRRQAPIGPKLTKRAFGKDWRMPVSNLYDPCT